MVMLKKDFIAIGKKEKIVHGRPLDMWATGCTLFYLATGKPPYWITNRFTVKKLLAETVVDFSVFENSTDPDMKALFEMIKLMMEKDPEKRATVMDFANNAWLTKNGEEPILKYSFQQTAD